MEDKGKQDGRATLREMFLATRATDDDELTDGEFRFWMMVRSLEGADRGCYAGTEYMMMLLRRSESHIKKVRSILAKKGWLKVVRRGPKEPELRAVIPEKEVHQDELQVKEVHKEVHEEVHSQEHSPTPPIEKSSDSSRRQTYMSAFEKVWKIHRRGPKAKAADEYRVALKNGGVTHDEIVEALEAYRRTLTSDFRGLHLFRWFQDERWEEEVAKRNVYEPLVLTDWSPFEEEL